MLLIIILSILNVSKVCSLWPPKGSGKSTIISDNSQLGPQFSKYQKIMLTSQT